MTLLKLFETLRGRGVRLSLDEHDNLRLVGRRELLDEELVGALKQNKRQIVEWLRHEQRSAPPPVTALPRQSDRVPASFAQQRLWLVDQLGGGSPQYNMPGAMRVGGTFHEDVAELALARIVARHEPLRTVFVDDESGPQQWIRGDVDFRLQRIDLQHLPADEQEQAVAEFVARDAAVVFDLSRDLMLRACFLRLAPGGGVFVFNVHHIASDGWSIDILMREFAIQYEAAAQGRPDPMPALTVHYADYAQWQRGWLTGDVLDRRLAYWETQLAGLPTLHGLPLDRPRPAVQTFDGAAHEFTLSADTLAGLKRVALDSQTTLFMVLQAAFALLLSRHGGSSEIVIGTPVANRTQKQLEPLVGLFVNTLVLRIDCPAGQGFAAFLARVRTLNLDAQANQEVPFEYLVERLKPERNTSHSPLFQIMFSMATSPMQAADTGMLTMAPWGRGQATTKFELTLNATESATGLQLRFEYNRDLFDASTIARFGERLCLVADRIAADPEGDIGALTRPDEAEFDHLVHGLNATSVDLPLDDCIHERFQAQVERTPDAIALTFGDATLSYRELNARSNRLAHYLRAHGVGPDARVGLCVERSLEMVIGILGILKAGGAYVPLDPDFPADRVAYMLADSAPGILLTQAHLQPRLPAIDVPVLRLDANAPLLHDFPEHDPDTAAVGLTPRNLAYVFYTSGSTGRPKGVMNEHAGVLNRLLWAQEAFAYGSGACVLQKTPFSFDVSVAELLLPLLGGAHLVMARPGGHLDPEYLAETIERAGVTLVHFVPAMLQAFLDQAPLQRCASLREVLCTGEALSFALVQRFRQSLPRVALYNLYGPTEAAIEALWWDCQEDLRRDIVPIGRPIANMRVYILDAEGFPVSAGVCGELYLGGVGVARGYLNRPELTSERFLDDPFSRTPGARMYRTGDLGRWLPEGVVEFLGRNDFQVKIRGLRIELGEIEQQLSTIDGVRSAAVIACEDAAGSNRLVAYVATEGEESAGEFSGRLRRELLERLPDYMVPAAYVALAELPLSQNGKIDRQALAAIDAHAATADYVPPETPVELALCEVWQDVLKCERIGVADDFFALGGDSLKATRLVNAVSRRFAVQLPLAQVFRAPSVRAMAAQIGQQRLRDENRQALQTMHDVAEVDW